MFSNGLVPTFQERQHRVRSVASAHFIPWRFFIRYFQFRESFCENMEFLIRLRRLCEFSYPSHTSSSEKTISPLCSTPRFSNILEILHKNTFFMINFAVFQQRARNMFFDLSRGSSVEVNKYFVALA